MQPRIVHLVPYQRWKTEDTVYAVMEKDGKTLCRFVMVVKGAGKTLICELTHNN